MYHTFEYDGATVTFDNQDGLVIITANKCGFNFDIGQIDEAGSENPVIWFNKPVGFNLAEAIINEWRNIDRETIPLYDWEIEWMDSSMGPLNKEN